MKLEKNDIEKFKEFLDSIGIKYTYERDNGYNDNKYGEYDIPSYKKLIVDPSFITGYSPCVFAFDIENGTFKTIITEDQ